MTDIRRIGVMMEIDKPFKRHVDVFGGIREYAQRHPSWRLVIDDWAGSSLPDTRRGRVPFDGIIGRITPLAAERAKKVGVAVVNVLMASPVAGSLPGVFSDFEASGELVADHLMSRGFRFLAAHIRRGDVASHRQAEAMERFAKEAGIDGWLGTIELDVPADHDQWLVARQTLTHWMDTWKIPLALLVREPSFARWIIELARDRGWHVPHQLAIVLSANEEMQCEHVEPSLTAVEHAYEKIGYEAARMLDGLIDRKRAGRSPFEAPKTVLIPPIGIVSRHSTDFFAVSDPLVRDAMRYIAANLAKPLDAATVAGHLQVSRRLLDLRFHEAMGVTATAGIARLRLERVKRDLVSSDDSIEAIALRAGFGAARTLNDHFRKAVGISPSVYRKRGQV